MYYNYSYHYRIRINSTKQSKIRDCINTLHKMNVSYFHIINISVFLADSVRGKAQVLAVQPICGLFEGNIVGCRFSAAYNSKNSWTALVEGKLCAKNTINPILSHSNLIRVMDSPCCVNVAVSVNHCVTYAVTYYYV